MITRLPSPDDGSAEDGLREPHAWRGVDEAATLARAGRLISAIRLLEARNLAITREEAKSVVRDLGYGRELRWPEPEKLPLRRL